MIYEPLGLTLDEIREAQRRRIAEEGAFEWRPEYTYFLVAFGGIIAVAAGAKLLKKRKRKR